MKIVAVGYRDWALKIYDYVGKHTTHQFLMMRDKTQYSEKAILGFKPDLILFYGWSWRVGEKLLNQFPCIMLHPSPLPKYRGGTPIQNQIINGEKKSAVTLFLMEKEMDAGDIIATEEFSLEGHMADILNRITEIGTSLTLKVLEQKWASLKQDETEASYFKRRKSEDNEITIEELTTKPGEYLYNKIRMLEDPYPNAFFKTIDGKKLKIKFAELEDIV